MRVYYDRDCDVTQQPTTLSVCMLTKQAIF